jgi:hypothetical protein
VPAVSPTGLTLAVSVPLPEPEAGLRVNQAAVSLAVQLTGPPVLVMLRVCAAGLVPPCWAVKESAVGLAPMAGARATVKATATDWEATPGAATVIVL